MYKYIIATHEKYHLGNQHIFERENGSMLQEFEKMISQTKIAQITYIHLRLKYRYYPVLK